MKKILKYSLFFISLLTIVSCNNSERETLQLTVANQYITYVDTSQTTMHMLSYKNDTVRRNATSIITYTISNSTDKKYLLVFDTEFPEPMFSDAKDHIRAFVGYSIFSDKNLLKKFNPGNIDDFSPSDCIDCQHYLMINRINEYEKLGITKQYSLHVYNYLHNSVTIYPGEKKTFKSKVMLPVVLEAKEGGGGIISYSNLSDSDTFQLLYNCNAKHLKSKLPKYILDELKYNKIEIFDGQIISNKIPLKKVD